MRAAHAHADALFRAAAEGDVHVLRRVGEHGDALRGEARLVHVRAQGEDAPLRVPLRRHCAQAGERLDPHRIPLAALRMAHEHVVGDAADRVAAHAPLGTVRVEHAHPAVGRVGRLDEDQPVPADARVPVARARRGRGDVPRAGVEKLVYIDVVIPQTVHFHKVHGDSPFFREAARPRPRSAPPRPPARARTAPRRCAPCPAAACTGGSGRCRRRWSAAAGRR